MKISLQWLRELVDLPMDVEALAHALTMGGLEVEEVMPVAAQFSGIVVAHVKSVAPHPNADKLRVTEVDAGTAETLTIVCGAPNVAAGQKVPCAVIGAKLPSSQGGTSDKTTLDIKKAKLRGVESNGMLCSARELGLSSDHSGLLVLEEDAPIGRDIREYLDLDDVYLTLKLTPNRGDCLSMFGIARDVAAITGGALKLPAIAAPAAAIPDARDIHITERKGCGQYYGRVIRGIDATARTPEWMVRRLERAGLRSISPLVDITNYVMLERGQPMHAFDNARLKGAIGVRFMKPGEQVKLLNEQVAEYIPDLLAITDETGPVALGGVMGGFDTMVTAQTTDVFFEAAYFDPETIQGRARALALTSDAAHRFERGVDFAATLNALHRATQLTLEICGGEAGPATHADGDLPSRAEVRVRPPRVRALLGYDIADNDMQSILKRLACEIAPAHGDFKVKPPSWRFDLAIEEDFVEEIARIHGYEHVPADAPRSSVPMTAITEGARSTFDLRHALAALGYQEVINYSFVPAEWESDFAGNAAPVRLANPMASTMGVMRTSLIGGLVQTLRANLNRGEPRVRVFEIGRCFEGEAADVAVQPERIAGLAFGFSRPEQWAEAGVPVDFFDAKGDVESLAGSTALSFAPGAHPACHPGRCALVRAGETVVGVVGELHPAWQQKYELPGPALLFELRTLPLLSGEAPRFRGISRMPVVRRDLAALFPDGTRVGEVLAAVRRRLPSWVREFEVFDEYRGKGVEAGRKSLAFRIVMQDTDRTLTDSEVEDLVASIRDQLHQEFKAQPRT
jgi:phenylalanyl-tRNA synthetase beta chain